MLEQVRFRERTMLKLGLGCSLTYLFLVDTSTDGIKRTRVRMIYMCSWHTYMETNASASASATATATAPKLSRTYN